MMDLERRGELLDDLINEQGGNSVGQDEYAEIKSIGRNYVEIDLVALCCQPLV